MFVPLAVALELVGIARVEAAKDDRFAIGGDEMISLHADMRGLCQRRGGQQQRTSQTTNEFFHKHFSVIFPR